MKFEITELIESIGENAVIDGNNVKVLVEFGRDERGFDTKILTFISFADTYSLVSFRGVDYKVLDIFIDEFGVARITIGNINGV